MYSKYAGSEFKGEDGQYIVLRSSDVMAVLTSDSEAYSAIYEM